MFQKFPKAWVLPLCLTVTPAMADAPQQGLVIHLKGFTHERGQAIANLFYEGGDVFGRPHARAVARIQQGGATLNFPHLAHGSYAVIAFHDENGNNDLDHNLLRLPAEPLGFSNGFRFSLFSGMPSFAKLRFTFGVDTKPLEIFVK